MMFSEWMKNKYWPIGLDIAHSAIRAVQLFSCNHSLRVHAALELGPRENNISNTADKDYEFADSKIVDLLHNLMSRGGFVGRNVILHCPADRMYMRPITLPSGPEGLPREAILGAVKLNMDSHLPFPINQAVYDYFISDHDIKQGKLTVMTIITEKEWIKKRIEMVRTAGLFCVALDALPCTLTRIAGYTDQQQRKAAHQNISPNEAETGSITGIDSLVAILDIGYSGSTLIVSNRNGPVFCRRFSIGGCELTQILSQRLLINYEHAETLKLTYGLDCQARKLRLGTMDSEVSNAEVSLTATVAQDNEIAKTIYTSLQSDLADYVEWLIRSLNYVVAEHQGAQLDKILLCGSASHTKNLDHFLTEQFGMSVRIISHPLLAEILEYLPASRAQSGSWATALGLAILKGGQL